MAIHTTPTGDTFRVIKANWIDPNNSLGANDRAVSSYLVFNHSRPGADLLGRVLRHVGRHEDFTSAKPWRAVVSMPEGSRFAGKVREAGWYATKDMATAAVIYWRKVAEDAAKLGL